MAPTRNDRPVICTDDGWILFGSDPPPTVEDLRQKVVGALEGTPASFWWSVGDHEVYQYETQVGEILGDGYEDLSDDDDVYSFVYSSAPGAMKNVAENTRSLIAECGGPLTALVDLCREAGVEFFPRVRMNSHYEIDPAHPSYGTFRREHPELLIGRPGEDLPKECVEWGIRTGKDYAFPQVREYMARIMFEILERFDVDGMEMDFMRHPAFFRVEEAYGNRHLMTDLLRHVRGRMNELGRERGRDMRLAVRVPPTLADSARVGLDVARWMGEGLVDIVVVGGGFIPFETPIEEFVEAARDTDIKVYGCIEATRHADEKTIRALASRFWSAGASGTYLYNFYTMSPEWNRRVLNQIADPEALTRLDKRYELDSTGPFIPCRGHGCAFRYAGPSGQLPVTLGRGYAGRGPVLHFDIVDDLEAASADASLADCGLALRLDGLAQTDELRVRLNQQDVPWESSKVSFDGWDRVQLGPRFWMRFPTSTVEVNRPGISVEFDVGCPPLRQGKNELEVHLVTPDSDQGGPVVLKGVEVTVSYRQA